MNSPLGAAVGSGRSLEVSDDKLSVNKCMHSHLNQFSDFIDSIKSKSKGKDGLVSGVTSKQIVPLNLL